MVDPKLTERVQTVRARAALGKAIDALPLFIRGEVRDRIRRAKGACAALERAGLTRALGSPLQTRVMCAVPEWKTAKRLHRAWIAASVWDALVTAEEKSARAGEVTP